MPWADLAPNPRLVRALAGAADGRRAIVIGCGLGDDAEHVASLGLTTMAFDVSLRPPSPALVPASGFKVSASFLQHPAANVSVRRGSRRSAKTVVVNPVVRALDDPHKE